MFEIGFRDGSDGQLVWGARPDYNNEYIWHPYKGLRFQARIGESFMDFVSLAGDVAASGHPFLQLAGEYAEGITEKSDFLVRIREYMDLIVEDSSFATKDCYMFFLDLVGMSVPAFHYQLIRKDEHRMDAIEDAIPYDESMGIYERSLRAFLAVGKEFYDVPLTVYECETIEDACCASLHFLITHHFTIRKCRNCGKYFVAYNRSDSVYCDRLSPFNRKVTCCKDGAARTHREAVKNDRLKKLISNTQAMWRMRRSRFPDDDEIRQEAENFKVDLKQWQADYKAGKVMEEEFTVWLKHFNSKESVYPTE